MKDQKPKLLAIYLIDEETNETITQFPPTKAGENAVRKYEGLAGLKIIKKYE